ncbi:hypothetical protein N9052_02715 [bacterium]|nr:hypothetical protein [bacterium]
MFKYTKVIFSIVFAQIIASATAADSTPVPCQYVSGNLLSDTRFDTLHLPKMQQAWRYSQHSGEPSFSYDVNAGTLIFSRTGHEPWANLVQSVETSNLDGKRVEFSAEIRLRLSVPKQGRKIQSTPSAGLIIVAKKGNRTVARARLDREPEMSKHNWQRLSIIADIPKGTNYLHVGFNHKAGGTIEARDPALRIVTACSPTGEGV